MNWNQRIENRETRVCIVGLGYVGLPLAVEVANKGFNVVGIDVNLEKIAALKRGETNLGDVDSELLADLVTNGKLSPTEEYNTVQNSDAIIICVPTPLNKTKDPDVSFIVNSCNEIAKYLSKGQLVVLESTTYPGFTREVAVPLLEKSGLKAGTDFHVAFSPERIDPGNKSYGVHNTVKIIGGLTAQCTERTTALYGEFITLLHTVSSPDSAEMVKLLENTFRAVNIGLVNEVAQMCHKLRVNTWEVIDAAATKPFGFMPFYPGPGLGGHCIPIDPLYLSWKLKALNYQARFIELAHAINKDMPDFVVSLIQDALNEHKKALKGSKLLVLGVAYKKDIDDCRESPALEVIDTLQEKGSEVDFHDPFVPEIRMGRTLMQSVGMPSDFSIYDAVIITTAHTQIDYKRVVSEAKLVVDTRNATKNVDAAPGKIHLL
jgi:UDP-N-acetyl-D-glucosamine dehydrogenase